MNTPDRTEFQEKLTRIRRFFDCTGYEAMVIGRQDNFAWLTCGGSNRVLITSETGFTLLVVTRENVYAVAQVMDGPRVQQEELAGLGVEGVFLRWYEASREEKAAEIVRGKRTVCDVPVEGADLQPAAIYGLHYPLTAQELDKCRRLGAMTERVIRTVSDALRPGMTERDAEAMLHYEYAKMDATPEVLLVGSDERIAQFRHCNPTDKKIEKIVLLHPAVKWHGLHANVTRMVCFGQPDGETLRRYDAACQVEAAATACCVPGARYSDILEKQKALYARSGYADEWRNHFQGAATGYFLADTSFYRNPAAQIGPNQAWDWFITITGVKAEELGLNTERGFEIPSVTGLWPVKEYEAEGQTLRLPQILIR